MHVVSGVVLKRPILCARVQCTGVGQRLLSIGSMAGRIQTSIRYGSLPFSTGIACRQVCLTKAFLPTQS